MAETIAPGHPTDLIHGLLTAHVHQIKSVTTVEVKFSEESKHYPRNQLLTGWKIIRIFGDPSKSGFLAVLYECKGSCQVVLAFRSKSIQGDDVTILKTLDVFVETFKKDLIQSQVPLYDATKEALDVMRAKRGQHYVLTFTGHAFGAWLAELAIFYCHKIFECTFVDNLKAVTFESPGIYAQIEDNETNLVNGTPDVTNLLNIVTYLSSPNLLNVSHCHVGKVYRLGFQGEELRQLKVYKLPHFLKGLEEKLDRRKYQLESIFLAMKGCKLDKMLEKFDLITGRPKDYVEMADWPTIEYDQTADSPSNFKFLGALLPNRAKALVKIPIGRFFPSLEVVCKLVNAKINPAQLVNSTDPKNSTEILHQFYKSHCVVAPGKINLEKAPVHNLKGTLEWYLWKLHATREPDLDRFFRTETKVLLMALKDKYRLLLPDHLGRRILETLDGSTIEHLKDKMRHQLLTCTTLADHLSGVETETPTETLILKMQDQSYDCSVSNVIEAEKKKNFKLIPTLEGLFQNLKTNKIEVQFMSDDVAPLHLAKFLYTFNVLANFTLYNEHDGKKAREIVEIAKKLAEEYMRRKPEFPENFNFEKLDDAAIDLLTLSVDEDLLRVYTMLIYFQGRSYIYEFKELDVGKRYFEMCRKLGKKLTMFEGVLSIGRGVLVIEILEVEKQIKVKERTQEATTAAIEQLEHILDEFKELKVDDNAYIEGYKPGESNEKRVIPSQDNYNLVDCTEQELKLYAYLINLTTDKVRINEYVERVCKHFSDIFKLLNENPWINPRKKTSVLNNLGFILLSLYDKGQHLAEFRPEVTKALGSSLFVKPTSKDLWFIKAIFRAALPKQEGKPEDKPDFTTAETYNGLFKVNERLLKLDDLRETEYDEICEALNQCKNKRDEINEKLNRNKNL